MSANAMDDEMEEIIRQLAAELDILDQNPLEPPSVGASADASPPEDSKQDAKASENVHLDQVREDEEDPAGERKASKEDSQKSRTDTDKSTAAKSPLRPTSTKPALPKLDQMPPEIITEIITYFQAPPGVKVAGGSGGLVELLKFALTFQYCICEMCSTNMFDNDSVDQDADGPRKDIRMFPLNYRRNVVALSATCKRLRKLAIDSSYHKSVPQRFRDITKNAQDGIGCKELTETVRHLIVRYPMLNNQHLIVNPHVNYLGRYPLLESLLVDWTCLSPFARQDLASKVQMTNAQLSSDTLERLDIRMSESPFNRDDDGLALAVQLSGILGRLEMPHLRFLHITYNMPSGQPQHVRANWQAIMDGLKQKRLPPQLEVVRVSLWLGQGGHAQKFCLWKTALQDLLEHFRAQGTRPKIVLAIFYDVSEFDEALSMNSRYAPDLRPSLGPTKVTMTEFLRKTVVEYPETCDFDLIIHATPVHIPEEGALRHHEPLIVAKYRKPKEAAKKKLKKGKETRESLEARLHDGFQLQIHERDIFRLAALVDMDEGPQEGLHRYHYQDINQTLGRIVPVPLKRQRPF